MPTGVYFRVQLGGVTGHGDFARDSGWVLQPSQCVPAAAAVVRVFIAHGDRTDRKRARLKYLLDAWGIERFVAEVERELEFAPLRLAPELCRPRGPIAKHGHIGVHAQKQPGLSYVGVVLPAGRLSLAQLRGLADISESFGSGTIRLTVWQNLLLSDIPNEHLVEVEAAIHALGLPTAASAIRGGLVACTGNSGCKFSATDTKGQALQLAEYLDRRINLDQPINIHLTGCPNSCAQHYVGDIGLLGVKVGAELEEGYTIVVGGGAGSDRALAHEIFPLVPMSEVPRTIERMLLRYLARRQERESFYQFCRRHAVAELRTIFDGVATEPVPR